MPRRLTGGACLIFANREFESATGRQVFKRGLWTACAAANLKAFARKTPRERDR
jgi:hypothetical protein